MVAEAAALLRGAERPLIVSGGGTIYAEATDALRELAEATGVPVAETQAGKGSLPYDHPCSVGAIGATGTTAANALAREADVVLGVGTRYSDFTTASRTIFARPGVRFINLNVAPIDSHKQAGLPLIADARLGLEALGEALDGRGADAEYTEHARSLAAEWDATVERAYNLGHGPLPAQSEVIGVVNRVSDPRDVVVCAAGSMPGDLHKLWRTRDPKGYHVEYGYSCMGYEIAGGLGIKMADPEREVYVMVGDGSYLMMAQEIVTAVQEGLKLTIVLVQNHGFASIGELSETLGSQRFGTKYRYRGTDETLPVDLAANAAALGADVLDATTIEEFEAALRQARASSRTTVVQVHTDPLVPAPSSEGWWDVPVAEVSELESTRAARTVYDRHKLDQRNFLSTRETVETT
jgi:3D-(3,5/4)-trihydroxycyclohexane-1,2-dione acylhydrolase (decyclizing)